MPYKVLVTGSRDWEDESVIWSALRDQWLIAGDLGKEMLVIHGGAAGADDIADRCAHRQSIHTHVFPAQWSTYGKRAGFIRNGDMVNENPDIVLAFQKNHSKGAQSTIDLARKKGIPVRLWVLHEVTE